MIMTMKMIIYNNTNNNYNDDEYDYYCSKGFSNTSASGCQRQRMPIIMIILIIIIIIIVMIIIVMLLAIDSWMFLSLLDLLRNLIRGLDGLKTRAPGTSYLVPVPRASARAHLKCFTLFEHNMTCRCTNGRIQAIAGS